VSLHVTNVPADAVAAPRPSEYSDADARGYLRVAPDPGRRRLRTRLLALGIALLSIASVFTLVWFRVAAAQAAFSFDRLSKERMNEQLRYERLREEVAQRSSPDAIVSAALARGWVFGDRKEFLYAPAAAPDHTTPNAAPRSLAPTSYDKAKSALDQNP
jgi:hypothetical protein